MRDCFKMWVQWGYSPREFWITHPAAFWWTAEALVDKHKPKKQYAGGMTESVVADLYARQMEIDDGGR